MRMSDDLVRSVADGAHLHAIRSIAHELLAWRAGDLRLPTTPPADPPGTDQ